jgi:beta-lactamase regulating signal transducer with metallopeptidase domain
MREIIFSALLGGCVRGSAILAGVFVASALLKKSDPALRHMLWFAALVSLPATAIAFSVLPHITLLSVDTVASTPLGSGIHTPYPRHGWGAAACMARSLIARVLLGRLSRGASMPTGVELKRVREAAGECAADSDVRILVSKDCRVPVTFGAVSPVILIPEALVGGACESLRMVLQHEIAHVKRHDVLALRLAYTACSLFWFLPWVWIAIARLRIEQEKSCDLAAVRLDQGGIRYAELLLAMRRAQALPLILSRFSSQIVGEPALQERIENVLRPKQWRKEVKRSTVSVCALSVFICAACLGMTRCSPTVSVEKIR